MTDRDKMINRFLYNTPFIYYGHCFKETIELKKKIEIKFHDFMIVENSILLFNEDGSFIPAVYEKNKFID